MQKQVQKVSLLLVALFWLTSIGTGMAQIHLAGGTYQENFDGMGASGTVLPNGWAAVRLAGDGLANERLAPIVTEGSAFSGGIYNVGATGATERALGTLASSTTTPAFGVSLKNTTAGDITKLEISAIMEQWRSGSRNDRLETIIFEYSTDATSLITGTWTAASSLDLVEKLTATTLAEAVNGNEAAHQTQIGGTLAVNIPAGGTIWLRWKDADVTGSDGLYAIDNFQVTPTYTVVDNVAPQLVSGNPDNGATNVPTQLDFVLTFNEPIIAGTGQVTLNWSGGSISRSTSDPEVIYSDNTVTIKNLLLQPGTTYSATADNTAFKDGAGNNFAGIAAGTYSFTTSATGTPVIFTNESGLSFPLTQTGQLSQMKSYELSANYLQGPVTVEVTGPYQISKTDALASFGTTALTYSPAELATPQVVYVRFAPIAVAGNTGTIAHKTSGGRTVMLALSGTAFNPNTQNFDACATTLPGGWSQFSVTGAQVWGCTNFGRTGNAVQMSGYSGGNLENEDWLISPAIDLSTGYTYPLLSFWSRTAFAGNKLRLMVSTNYSGTGSPTSPGVIWTEINGQFPEMLTDVFTETKNIDLTNFKGSSNVRIAFVYNSTTAAAPRWIIDDFEVTDATTPPPAILISNLSVISDADFGLVAAGTSVTKTYNFSAESLYSDITLEVPAPFTLSKNGTDFSQSISYTKAEAANNNFTVKFTAPASTIEKAYAGQVSFKGENLTQTIGYLTGAVLNKDNTFDVVTWNIEWFGATGNGRGPSDEALQRENVKKVVNALDADVYAFQEISDVTAFNELKAILPNYEGFMSSYANNTQEVAYFYKKSTVTEVRRKYLLSGVSNISNFWASGRFPYLLEVDANINGITKRFHLINIHAKANDNTSPEEALAAYNRRKEDVLVLKDSLDTHFPNANIIMLGDYNDDIDVTVADITSTTASTYKVFVDDAARYSFATMPLSQAGLRSYVSREDVIDHIMYSNELANFYIENSARVVIPYAMVGVTTPDDYTSTTSDHLPAIARFSMRSALGVEEDSRAAGFKVFPSPTAGNVQVVLPVESKSKIATLKLLSVRGEVLLQTTGNEQALGHTLSQRLAAHAAGMYFVVVQVDGKTYQARIVKH